MWGWIMGIVLWITGSSLEKAAKEHREARKRRG